MDQSIHDESSAASESDGDQLSKGEQSSINGSTEGGDNTSRGSSSKRSKKEKFVQKESRYVLLLRVLVLVILILAAIAICCVVYIVTEGSEGQSVDSHYEAAAEKVIDTFMEIATNKMGAAGSLVVAIVAHGIALGNSWPFVTLSSFQERSATVMRLSGALYIGMNPIVKDEYRKEWENYSTTSEDAMWYEQGRNYQQELGFDGLDNRPQVKTDDPRLNLSTGVANYIYDFRRDQSGKGEISPTAPWYLPIWQTSPITKRSMVNQNRASNSEASIKALELNEVVLEGMQYSNPGYGSDDNPLTAEIAWLLRLANRKKTMYDGDIFSTMYFPLYDNFSVNRSSVGVMRIVIHWARFFRNVLPASTVGIVVVLENGCDQPFTYQIDGRKVTPLGHGDLHDPKYDSFEWYASFRNVSTIADGTQVGMKLHQDSCQYAIRVYPSTAFEEEFHTNTPAIITTAVALVFIFTVIMFFVYDWLVERRQKILLNKATRTHQIVASLFPKHVRDQILQEDMDEKKGRHILHKSGLDSSKEEVEGEIKVDGGLNVAPIADLFPEASIFFADICGFTAWSSSREPQQVFILLQNVYHGFDIIAKHRKVFKVETVGDSYVAAAGVPEPQPTHAVIVARFAWECLMKMNQVTRDLESLLGPDTGELSLRIGIHSGPVTAGVLRGAQSRFQLFGDTVNTASRMESTGLKGRIQCSQSTAEALAVAGKQHWVRPREDLVSAKGKGILKTYWIVPNSKAGSESASTDNSARSNFEEIELPQEIYAEELLKREREIDWITELLSECIRHIMVKQELYKVPAKAPPIHDKISGQIPLDDVVDTIRMPETSIKAGETEDKAKHVKIPERVSSLLRQYVSIIASAYKQNSFHNFEHACHVTMSVNKFLKRIMAHDLNQEVNTIITGRKGVPTIDDFTKVINSDPVTHLACLLSAVIHDVDHLGISNVQLAKEAPNMAARYRGKSLAEQNSFEIAWDLLMADHFDDLRAYIFALPEELVRFRQLLVNMVLATDIFDKELNGLRKARWAKAFGDESSMVDRDARATVVLEHIIQASDICHCMQHWHVYQKWMRKFFAECLKAYREGRLDRDPSTFWYKGELNFYDNYVIPLARKLKDCAVFGVSSDECLNYTIRNRAEWETQGESVIAELMEGEMSDEKDDGRLANDEDGGATE